MTDLPLVFYGTLMAAFPTQDRLGIREGLEPAGACLVPGELYDLGWYPGLVPGRRLIKAELFRTGDPAVLEVLDRFEGFDPADPAGSEYLRQEMTLHQPKVQAWVYVYNRPVTGRSPVAADDWAAHLAAGRVNDPRGWEEFFRQRM